MNQKKANQTRTHNHIPEVATSGGFHFSGGEVWDDVRSTVVCRVCGKNLDPRKQPITSTITSNQSASDF